jgi:hypothetical protein
LLRFIVGALIVLHGLVHGLYFGHCRRLFELQPGMVWPEGSWVVSKLFGGEFTRRLASVSFAVAAAGFVAGGVGFLANQAWWRPMVMGAAGFAAVITILFWDGTLNKLHDQGGIGLLIDVAILAALFTGKWP